MQNEPNFKKTKTNVTSAKIKDYENKPNWTLGENEPNSNPIYGKTNPISNFTLEFSYIKREAMLFNHINSS